ncbi:MAG: putative Uracil-DNA glycosylase superfamily [Anaerolineales bacterium]|nr:putative Uracil-DNA glycosylase superfamily [Anaerolineales bacterium]MBM2848795.1 putative Uracil-DNA glycosylase superfamily [Anaerolineales bacterium]
MPRKAAALAALHAQIRACRKCLEAGYWIAPGAVVHGAYIAKVMTIGQAPGPTEAVVKRPFNAGAGKRLFEWLGEAGFDEATFRATQSMTAVTKCYPGQSAGGHGDRVPSKEEQALCRPWLDQEIKLINPELVIPIGRLAIGLFFDAKLPLEKIIGTQIEQDGRVIVPLPHPSGASTWHQKPENRARVKKAIRLIRKQRERLGL